jgi:hypothetical protein
VPDAPKQPEHYENEQYQAKNATKPGATVAAMSVVPTAAAE